VIYLSAESISKAYVDKVLFEDISFSIEQGEKVALIGKNGTGKSTLLNIAALADDPDSGKVYLREEITTGYFRQQHQFKEDNTIFETIFASDNPVIVAIREYEESLESPDDHERLQRTQARMDSLEAWDFEIRIKTITSKLKLDTHAVIKNLSGGEKHRVALAKVLIEQPDFLILDEPTNHLDLDMIEWLEDYLSKQKLSLLMVTHDRYFLEAVCNRILELDDTKIHKHKGSYSFFLEARAIRKEIESTEVTKAKNLFRRELDWMRRSPKARTTKAKARITSFHELDEKAHRKTEEEVVQLHLLERRMGSKILELYNVNKAYGDLPILENYSYKFKRGERLGIVGRNGSGKTTFLKMITGVEPVDSGKVVKGETIEFGHYTQEIKLKENLRVIDVVREIAETIMIDGRKQVSPAQLLERFLFSRDEQYKPISKLSGGEKRRLALLTVLVKSPNFLILDEPTNDLDILTLHVLEEFLQEFKGCLLIVSHDRFFMDKLVDEVMVFQGKGKIKLIHGNYTAYRNFQLDNQPAEKEAKKDKPAREKEVKEKTKLTFGEKREYEQLEQEIADLEQRKTSLNEELNSGTLDHEALASKGKELTEVINLIDEKSERWLELSEYEN
jgi:ATP-binding cassette subfamily F protein uup